MLGLGLEETLLQYLRAVGWSVTAAVGFAFGVGIALKVFDYLSTCLLYTSPSPRDQ